MYVGPHDLCMEPQVRAVNGMCALYGYVFSPGSGYMAGQGDPLNEDQQLQLLLQHQHGLQQLSASSLMLILLNSAQKQPACWQMIWYGHCGYHLAAHSNQTKISHHEVQS